MPRAAYEHAKNTIAAVFLLTSLIANISPGTGVLYTLAAGLAPGPRASMVAILAVRLAPSPI